MSALALSVLLSLVSAVAYAAGAIVQERVAATDPGESYAPLRRPAWWGALALNALGGLLHVVALAYGPLSLVQPLGALTIVLALPMAALFVGRRAGATAWRGAIMATAGLAGLLALVGMSAAQSLDTAQRVSSALVAVGAVAALMVAGRAAQRHPAVRGALLATAAGVAFGMSSVFTKTVAVDLTGGPTMSEVPSLAVIGVFACAGVLLSQASYRGAGLTAPLATLTVVNPVVAAAVGITMFGETFRHGTTGTVLALGCGVLAAGGLILLTTERLAETAGASGTRGAAVRSGTQVAVLSGAADAGAVDVAVPGTVPLEAAALSRTDAGAVHVAVPGPVPAEAAALSGADADPVEAPVPEPVSVEVPVVVVVPAQDVARTVPVVPAGSGGRSVTYRGGEAAGEVLYVCAPLYVSHCVPVLVPGVPVLVPDRHRTRVRS
ncbi:DMT family transporter [Streptomyces sp. NPDC014006]|uniref:DMT family transporter n=1 Tax=Streptomyces sp. NPDC014006 TaxID=3364870 RepID=UPI003702A303